MAESNETVDAPQLTMSNLMQEDHKENQGPRRHASILKGRGQYGRTATIRPKKHTTPRSRGVKRSHTVPHGSRTKMAGLNATAVCQSTRVSGGPTIKQCVMLIKSTNLKLTLSLLHSDLIAAQLYQ